MKILECIPNFSEGRDQKKIKAIVDAITSVPNIMLLGQESDRAHHRSVVTFAGPPEAVVEAAFAATKIAARIIDLGKHRGEHPRMGATDVIPLVPIAGISEEECIPYAEALGKRIGEELKIPVYLYEKAARKPERKNLADIRRGEFEGIKAEIGKNPARDPDFGPKQVGPAGATAVGVRFPLVAFNVNLKTTNLTLAKSIAKKVRFKDGGFLEVKALGFELKDRGLVQVSMNLTNYAVTNVHQVFQAIEREAKKSGVEVEESEVIGLISEDSLLQAAKIFLKAKTLKNDQVLEKVLREKMERGGESLSGFLDRVASKNPVPGGGSVSALAGSLAAALCSMVANLTKHTDLKKILKKTEELRHRLFELIEEDAKAYQAVADAYKTKNTKAAQLALKNATLVPLETAQMVLKLNPLLKILFKKGNPNTSSDLIVSQALTSACVKGALANVEVNLKAITDKEFVKKIKKRILGKLNT